MKKRSKLFKKLKDVETYLIASPLLSALIFIFSTWMTAAYLIYHFESDVKDHNINSFEDAVWWGIVTLSTTGYGDRYPVSLPGRVVGAGLIVTGLIGIAIVTAKISSFFLERALRERRGFVDSSTLKNHFVICAWKDEMANFLLHVLDANPNIKDSDLVLLNAASEQDIEALREIPRLKNIKIIRGEYFQENNLRRAAPERASKILILADATVGPKGTKPTITEADARTVMTAMALSNIAKGVPITAEVIESSMDQYLKIAHVDEIVYSRDYSRMLLAMSSGGTGITNIFHDLLSPASAAFVTTKSIPESLMGSSYGRLQEYYWKEKPTETLLGILENSGNSQAAKETALKRAQQTPNISELVKNLHQVKALRFNRPIFGPKHDYTLMDGAMAIVIENRLTEDSGETHV